MALVPSVPTSSVAKASRSGASEAGEKVLAGHRRDPRGETPISCSGEADSISGNRLGWHHGKSLGVEEQRRGGVIALCACLPRVYGRPWRGFARDHGSGGVFCFQSVGGRFRGELCPKAELTHRPCKPRGAGGKSAHPTAPWVTSTGPSRRR